MGGALGLKGGGLIRVEEGKPVLEVLKDSFKNLLEINKLLIKLFELQH